MTYKRRERHFWHAAPGTAIVATLAMVGVFLAPTVSTRFGGNHDHHGAHHDHHGAHYDHDGAHHDHHRGAGFKLFRCGERDSPRPHRLVGHHRRSL